MKKINLFKREYLRGVIHGQSIKLSKPWEHRLEDLEKAYRKYIRYNPTVKDDIKNYERKEKRK